MKIQSIIIACILCASPILVFAQQQNQEQETLERLSAYISVLVEEIKELQQRINGTNTTKVVEPIESAQMRSVISKSIDWMQRAQEENGHLRYEYVPYEDRYRNDDNIVRQAGALYALGEVARRDTSNTYPLKEHMESSIEYFESLSHLGQVGDRSFMCIGNSVINESCQLGTTALALVGIIGLVEKHPELKEKYDNLIHDYGSYLVAMKKPYSTSSGQAGSGFRGFYTANASLNDKESSFSNGEALLGLIRYYQYEPDGDVKDVIDESFTYFQTQEFDFPLYLWAMAAIKDMHALWGDEAYVTYVRDYTNWRMNGFFHRKGSDHNMCAYIEGVISAYSVLKDDVNQKQKEVIENEIYYWLEHLEDLHIDESDRYRLITQEDGSVRFGEITNMTQAHGGFLTSQSQLTQRIDYTQHCLNSYVQQLVDIEGESL